MGHSGRARRYLVDAVDGEQMDAPVRRGLVANAESIDALRNETTTAINGLRTENSEDISELRDIVSGLKRTFVGSSAAVCVAVVSSALGVIYRLG